MAQKPQAVRCQNKVHLGYNSNGGNMVMVLKGDSIYVNCPHKKCRRWIKLKIDIPGVKLDFGKVGFVQETMPENFVFGTDMPKRSPKRIPVVIKETV